MPSFLVPSGSLCPPPLADFASLFKCGNADFKDTLPSAVILLTWLVAAVYALGAVLVFGSGSDTGIDLSHNPEAQEGLDKLGKTINIIVGFSYLFAIIMCILFNYIVWWAARTENKCWLVVMAVCSILNAANQSLVTTDRQVGLVSMMQWGFPIKYTLPALVAVVVELWLGVLCAFAGGRAAGPSNHRLPGQQQPQVQMMYVQQQQPPPPHVVYSGVVVAQVVNRPPAAGAAIVEEAKPVKMSEITLS